MDNIESFPSQAGNQSRWHRIVSEGVYQLDALLELMIEQKDHDGYDLKMRSLTIRARQLNGAVMSLVVDGETNIEECENIVYGLTETQDD